MIGARLIYRLMMGVSWAITASAAPAATMTLGVQTHFSQGWPIALLQKVHEIGAPMIRDSLLWDVAEKSRGVYDFSKGAHLAAACHAGLDVLVVINPLNPLYDAGKMVSSPEGRSAYAAYVSALADRYPCITAVEVGNELNGSKWYRPGDPQMASDYVAILRALREKLQSSHRRVAVLGGSTNLIGNGFLESLFAAGMLDTVDAVVVHPYRRRIEGVDLELERLSAAMRRHGDVKPIWATEFSDNSASPEIAARLLIKMVSMMASAGVDKALWYALVDQPWFKNMGLFNAQGAKPAARAFMLAERLLKLGPVRRLPSDPASFVFSFGDKALVMWGSQRGVHFQGKPEVVDAEGTPRTGPVELSDEPIIALNTTKYSFDAIPIIADDLLGFGRAPWSYVAGPIGSNKAAVAWRDWRWSSRFELSDNSGSAIESGAVFVSPRPDGVHLGERYTADRPRSVRISACFDKAKQGDGIEIAIEQGNRLLLKQDLVDRVLISNIKVNLAKGDFVDFLYAAKGGHGGNKLHRRIQLVDAKAAGPSQPLCD
jgi:hypothetical protein